MMTEAALLEIIKRLPSEKAQEVYDFALFLDDVNRRSNQLSKEGRLEGFSSENEMVDFIDEVGQFIYAD